MIPLAVAPLLPSFRNHNHSSKSYQLACHNLSSKPNCVPMQIRGMKANCKAFAILGEATFKEQVITLLKEPNPHRAEELPD